MTKADRAAMGRLCSQRVALPEPSDTHGATTEPSTEVKCAACGHVQGPADQCEQCRCWLPGNVANLRHGLRRYVDVGVLPDDLREYLIDFRREVAEDLGGEAELSRVQLGLVDNLADLEAARLLLLDYALRQGTDTKRGRAALSDHGSTVDRWGRVAKMLGLRREPRPAQTLAEVMDDE